MCVFYYYFYFGEFLKIFKIGYNFVIFKILLMNFYSLNWMLKLRENVVF